jgi:hypothetical protein
MKLLYLCFVELVETSGISKKMLYQVKAFQNAGFDTKLCYEKVENDTIYRKIYGTSIILEKVKNKKISRQFLHYKYEKLIKYILEEKVKVIYIRYNHIANPGFLNFLKILKRKDIKIILEIPTYPYDLEYINVGTLAKLKHKVETIYRLKMKKYVDRVVTFSEDKEIFGIKTISINNGISLEDISIIEKTQPKDKNKINFIGVAGISFWHGFDRMLLAMAEYYKKVPKKEVIFHIVGDGDKNVIELLKKIVKDNNLEKYVIFYGFKSGKELDEIYNKSDIAVGCLGIFRKKIYKSCTLKVREYCAKGLPFIMGEEDYDIKNVPFLYKVTNDETIFDVEKIIEWYNNLKVSAEEIREYTKNNLTWDIQMKKVIYYIQKSN